VLAQDPTREAFGDAEPLLHMLDAAPPASRAYQ
jgi:hypothetical protein